MCGIAGYLIKTNKAQFAEASKQLQNLVSGITHRGPDESGFYEEPGQVGIGMRRLSIIDIKDGHQPIENENHDIQLVFNGEIYNYLELRNMLETKGHQFRTRSDTEVIVHLYEEFGEGALDHLRGMFAFALWDKRSQALWIARDRLGKKPLHYIDTPDCFYFCSEIAPLARLPQASKDLNPQAVHHYLSQGYIPSPQSIFSSIQKLPPATHMRLSGHGLCLKQYWQLSFEPKFEGDYNDAKSAISECIDESIQLRLRSDVPIGLLLSGGLDSGLILARIAKHLNHNITTYSAGSEHKKWDERDAAAYLSQHFGAKNIPLELNANLLDRLPKIVQHYGEPFADKSALPSFALCEAISKHTKVALNGDGGDEAFAGYQRYQAALNTPSFPSLTLKHKSIQNGLSGYGLWGKKIGREIRRKLYRDTASIISSEFFAGHWMPHIATAQLRDASKKAAMSTANDYCSLIHTSHIDTMLSWDYSHYLADNLLPKMDIASMAMSLEVRSPLLDHKFVELAASLPHKWKVSPTARKCMLRDIASEDIPTDYINRPKSGFSIPLELWFRNEAKSHLRDHVNNLHPSLHSWVNKSAIQKIADQHINGTHNHAQRIWSIMVLNAWAQNFLG